MAKSKPRESAAMRLRALPAPSYLKPPAKKIWQVLVAEAPLKFWGPDDIDALAAYCTASVALGVALRAGDESRVAKVSLTQRRLGLHLRLREMRSRRGKGSATLADEVASVIVQAVAATPADPRKGLLGPRVSADNVRNRTNSPAS